MKLTKEELKSIYDPIKQAESQEELWGWLVKVQPDFDTKESYQHGFHDAIQTVKDKLKTIHHNP